MLSTAGKGMGTGKPGAEGWLLGVEMLTRVVWPQFIILVFPDPDPDRQ